LGAGGYVENEASIQLQVRFRHFCFVLLQVNSAEPFIHPRFIYWWSTIGPNPKLLVPAHTQESSKAESLHRLPSQVTVTAVFQTL